MDQRKKGIVMAWALMLLPLHGFSSPLDYYYQRYLDKRSHIRLGQSIEEHYFSQLIKHEDPAAGRFSQRYYVDETYAKSPDSPVFFYICGEAACSPYALYGAIRTYAEQFNARLVALEHRFYGKSLPGKLSVENLQNLSTQAALDDLAHFQKSMMAEKNWKGKWVSFGGSYPGSLSAYYRLQHPELVVGALASSAPVRAKEDFNEYDQHVTRVAGVECATQMRQVVQEVENVLELDDQQAIAQLKEQFSAGELTDNTDFLYMIADVGAAAVQYGMHEEFCTLLSKSTTALEGYATFTKKLFRRWQMTASDMTPQGALNEDGDYYSQGVGSRQWYYQSCTEYGYWQNAHPDPLQSTRSARINAEYHRNVCWRLFGIDAGVDTSYINQNFYSPLLDSIVSRIYFTNGSNDPWSKLSLSLANGNANNPNLNYSLIDGTAHCDDLRAPLNTDVPALRAARQTFVGLLREWLGESSH
ncbi:serine carboxypeptidase [Legionella birminghamensis]|uniref:Serine carboxypeptidase n=1 Tax=Legionella birminghamensis TaxID=28083 RepID=A0A378ICD8_9GAMM|nr:S28 family serine protease [Legionella birminghamensis]KTC72577.1 serine carboxypeptidase [Legionella birminghamensis]STX32849.1 serine carboxypeptidase [Legionella birminghamensis]